MNKTTKFILKLLVGLGFLAWVVFKVNWSQIFIYLTTIDLWKLFVYVALIVFGIAISAHKWGILAKHKDIHNSFGDYYRFYLTGTFINNFMPSFIGGDTFRAYQIGHADKKYIEAASSVMADRLTGFISMTILALFFSLLNFRETLHNNFLIIIDLVLVLSLMSDVVIAKTRRFRIWKKIMERIPQKIARFIEEVQNYSDSPKILTRTILYGMLFQFVGVALSNLVLFWALGINISLMNYFSVIFLISLISSIPISINNIGIKEWAYVTFFGIYGLDSSAVVTVSILSRIIQMLISFFALPTYLKSKK
jgi:uncharacterized protein (TIRG00374 family)